MNRPIHFRTIASPCLIGLAAATVVWLGFLPIARAVMPAPDGFYPPGNSNTAEGFNAMFSNPTGSYNTAVGLNALYSDASGARNTGIGVNALRYNVAGASNTAVGVNALYVNTASFDTAIGDGALFHNTSGYQNTAIGYQALFSNTTAYYNTAIGSGALSNETGGGNTAIGVSALAANTASENTAIGYAAGSNATVGSYNVYVGAGVNAVPLESNATRIRNIGSTPQASGIFVTIDGTGGRGDGKLGYQVSSRRYKEEIQPMDDASESLYRLTPVTFRYKKELDPQGTRQYGLIAEDVAKVNPDLVVNDPDGKPATLRFLCIQALMLNELLREHGKVEQLKHDFQTTIAQQQKEIQALTVQLKEQAAQIQKVSAQLAASNPTRGGPAAKVAVNDH
jgi:hypothetical protein